MRLDYDTIYTTRYRLDRLIPVQTERTRLLLGVNAETGELLQLGYGPGGGDPAEGLPQGPGRPGEELAPAYSAFGSVQSAGALRVTHADGGLSTELVYVGHDTRAEADGRVLTVVRLRDRRYPFEVALHFRASVAEDVIEAWAEFRHDEPGPVVLEAFASAQLVFPDPGGRARLTTLHGLWEREHSVQEESLGLGRKVLENTYGVWPSFGANPGFLLSLDGPADETAGTVVAGALAWSGNWRLVFDADLGPLAHDETDRRRLTVTAGIDATGSAYHLDPGRPFAVPPLVLTWSAAGRGRASRNLHRWARRRMPKREADGMVVLNSWEGAYFDFSEARLLAMMDGAAAMGAELFVLDDGWFGNGADARNSSRAGLGDWQCNRAKLPRGLAFLAAEAARRGLGFGLWVEPEMVNPQSACFRDHPEWVIRQPGRDLVLYRSQAVLDLGNPEVQDFVHDSVAGLLRATPGIRYVKWDCNRPILQPGSSRLPPERQSHLWIDYTRGLYRVLDRLLAEFPEVLFQACASGGGRLDHGILARCGEAWTSDNTDAVQRVFIQWGAGLLYPPEALAAHVTVCPNHQTGHTAPLKYRLDVAMSGRLGLELDPRDLAPGDLALVRAAVQDYRRLRPVLRAGELHRLRSPYEGPDAVSLVVAPGRERAVLFAYRITHLLGHPAPVARLRGLDPEARYRLRELNRAEREPHTRHPDGTLLSGRYLMDQGLRVALAKDHDSAVLELERDA